MAAGGLFGFSLASYVLSRGFDAFRMASLGAMLGVPAFVLVILAAPLLSPMLFGIGTFLIGFGAGLFGHGTLTATMNNAPPDQRGLALGAWGAVQATAAGIGVALGGIIRDTLSAIDGASPLTPYLAVYMLEVILLIAAIVTMTALFKTPSAATTPSAHIR
jgi:BCD family chlorophyll transporter-like MFS transporter